MRAVQLVLLALLGQVSAATAQPLELTITAPPALAGLAARVEAVQAAPLADALAQAGLDLPPRVHVTLIDVDDPLTRQTPEWLAGQAFGDDEIVLFPARIGSYPHDSLESVVLHEVVHLALSARAGGRPLPRWFHEGVAMSVESGWGVGSQLRLLAAAARGPAIDDITTLFSSETGNDITTAYLLSAALVEDLRRRHGLTAPGAIAGRVGRGETFDAAFRAETGESVNEAAAHAWRVYRGLRWLPVLTSPAALWAGILFLASVAFVVRLRRRRLKRWEEDEGVTALDGGNGEP
jgi:hypothetical protein